MKFGSTGVLAAVLAMLAVSATSALAIHPVTVTVTPDYLGKVTVFPGAADDFTLFGNPATYPGLGNGGGNPIPTTPQPTVLTNFGVTPGAGENLWQGGVNYSNTVAPDGKTYGTGLLYGGSPNTDVATVTLKNTPGYDYGDFNLYVMFGNADANGTDLGAVTVTINGTTYSEPVTDEQTDYANGTTGDLVQVEEFNIQGLSGGDTFTVGSVTANGSTAYLGALSFAEAPEPSTYAMMLVGVGIAGMVWRVRGRMLVG